MGPPPLPGPQLRMPPHTSTPCKWRQPAGWQLRSGARGSLPGAQLVWGLLQPSGASGEPEARVPGMFIWPFATALGMARVGPGTSRKPAGRWSCPGGHGSCCGSTGPLLRQAWGGPGSEHSVQEQGAARPVCPNPAPTALPAPAGSTWTRCGPWGHTAPHPDSGLGVVRLCSPLHTPASRPLEGHGAPLQGGEAGRRVGGALGLPPRNIRAH